MVQLLDQPDALPDLEVGVDEAQARRALRAQITRLEQQLADCYVTSFEQRMTSAMACPVTGSGATPRVMTLGELEELRDSLARRIREGRESIADHADEQARNRITLEKMRLAPEQYKFQSMRKIDVGEPGCGTYEVKPRLGLIGMLCGWWHVKLSSGCPLATSHLGG